jgi:hypothetical protein
MKTLALAELLGPESQLDVPELMANVWFADVPFVVAAKIWVNPESGEKMRLPRPHPAGPYLGPPPPFAGAAGAAAGAAGAAVLSADAVAALSSTAPISENPILRMAHPFGSFETRTSS